MKLYVPFIQLVCIIFLGGNSSTMTVSGFVSPAGSLLSNTTKSRLMFPLRVDHIVGLVSTNDMSESDNATISTPPAPRGIILNSAVGGLTIAGGLVGFITKGSKASLIAGSTFGGLLLLSALLISKKSRNGNVMGAGVAGMLSYVMGKKFLVSKKIMPAGLIAFFGTVAFTYNMIEAYFTSHSDDGAGNE